MLTSELQFGGVIHNNVQWCAQSCCFTVFRWGSKVYGCLVDASKAFDTVDHTILLDKLLSRGLPNAMVRFLLRWYQSRHLRTKWNGFTLDAFSVSWGVRQGEVLSPVLFTLYIDDLLKECPNLVWVATGGISLLEHLHMLMT